jgi:hypothetical protein
MQRPPVGVGSPRDVKSSADLGRTYPDRRALHFATTF